MLRIIAVIALSCLTACGGNMLLDGSVKQQRGEGYSSPEPVSPIVTPDPPLPAPAEPTITPWAPLPDTAVVPVPVSGASLFCYREGSVNCLASDSKGSPLKFKPFKVYYSDSKSMIWVPTVFVAAAKPSTWTVQLPENVIDEDIDILLLSEDNFYLANWISPKPDMPLNLVKDGSFDNIKIDPLNLETTRFLVSSSNLAWKARIDPTANCVAIIEQSSIDYSAIPAAQDGSQWVQLTSPCEPGLGSQRSRVAISQVLALKIAHQYELSFYYQAPLRTSKQTELSFSYSPNLITSFTVTQNTWTLYKTVFTATLAQQTLEFAENGLVVNGGTALDNISIIEIGAPESRIILDAPSLVADDAKLSD